MNKIALIILTLGLIVFLGIIFTGGSSLKNNSGELVNNVEVRDGIQYITINAKGGYTPKISYAKAGIPTKLIMKTTGTFDCSSSLVIREIGFEKVLPMEGELEIDLGIPKIGEPMTGLCSRGMDKFQIDFS